MSFGSKPWRIAVTGSTGFVGSHFRQYVAGLGRTEIEVVSLTRMDGTSVDIRDAGLVADAVARCHPDVVLHLAAIALPSSARAEPAAAWNVNVIGSLNIAQAIRSEAPDARLLYVGSSEAYGSSFMEEPKPLRENAALVPRSAYGSTKAAADLMIGQMAMEGLKAVRFRPFNHTGPGQTVDYVVPAFARQVASIEQGKQPAVVRVGNLEAERDFLDVRDVVAAYAQAALPETELPVGAVMNLATGAPIRIQSILSMLVSLANQPIDIEIDPARLRTNDIARASGSAERAKDMLGWVPKISLANTIRDVLNYWRNVID